MATRKELIRAYKETPRPMGVYRVFNHANGKSLVGAWRDVRARLNRQEAELKYGIHPNQALLADWKALGKDAFLFEILDTLEPSDEPNYDAKEDLEVLEALWLEKLQPYGDKGYNTPPQKPSE
jgi:alkanesulfonate monooxygenase SsuD/methylene tetrahydromethanopterin reductase-like flavin-dependent oxidoreductase (luciferase family)